MSNSVYEKITGMVISSITVPLDKNVQDVLSIAAMRLRKAGIKDANFSLSIFKRSIDARDRQSIKLVYSVLAVSKNGIYPRQSDKFSKYSIKMLHDSDVIPELGKETVAAPPLVVGMGPAGLYAALMLARYGYRPIVIDRGDAVENRVEAVTGFYADKKLDCESNIQFGAGGAGTFSDGKLMTRIHDPICTFVLKTFVQYGAPMDVMLMAKPHVGTDLLRDVVKNMLAEIQRLGGNVHYRCRLDGFEQMTDGTVLAHTTQGDILCGCMILAIGHSARDTYKMLLQKQMDLVAKPISVGVRIEHLTTDIDSAMYGSFAGNPLLGHAEYALSDTRTQRGVYTFCMCPGGEVMAAASEENSVVVNGMSYRARNGCNSNAAVVVSLGCDDYEPINGSLVEGAIALQRQIERQAFLVGGSTYAAPVQTVGDFLNGTVRHEPSRVMPTYMSGYCKVADLTSVFPETVNQTLRYGLGVFDQKLEGFAAPDAVLTGAETRTSSPVRIIRNDVGTAPGFSYVYPCGEGAGYAGGITSAAVDGVRTALAVMKRYAPYRA